MIEDRTSSEPISGPTVVTLRGRPPSASPNGDTSSRLELGELGVLRDAAPGVGLASVLACRWATATALARRRAGADRWGSGGDAAPLADGDSEKLGSGVCGGSEADRLGPDLQEAIVGSRRTVASGWPSSTSAACTSAGVGSSA